MWGTTSFCDELTGDFGGAFEIASVDDRRLLCRLAENWSHSILGVLQHYLPKDDMVKRGRRRGLTSALAAAREAMCSL
jgi:hypothetical protein